MLSEYHWGPQLVALRHLVTLYYMNSQLVGTNIWIDIWEVYQIGLAFYSLKESNHRMNYVEFFSIWQKWFSEIYRKFEGLHPLKSKAYLVTAILHNWAEIVPKNWEVLLVLIVLLVVWKCMLFMVVGPYIWVCRTKWYQKGPFPVPRWFEIPKQKLNLGILANPLTEKSTTQCKFIFFSSVEYPWFTQSVSGISVWREHTQHVTICAADRDIPRRRTKHGGLQSARPVCPGRIHGDWGGEDEQAY